MSLATASLHRRGTTSRCFRLRILFGQDSQGAEIFIILSLQVAEEPEVADDVMKELIGIERSDSSHSLSDEGSSSRAQSERKMHRRHSQVAERVAQKLVSMRAGDGVNQVVPKIPEFEELLYIYCQKPSEMKERHEKGGPLLAGQRAVMANLSEPQLDLLIKNHPNSLIE